MGIRVHSLLACLVLATPAAAETVYKYRGADGTVTYSNRLIRGAELIETFDYNFPAARAPARPATSIASRGAAPNADAESRMKSHLSALDRAWANVQTATRVLESAEARLAAGDAPLEGENTSLATPPGTAPQAVGGAAPAASPAVGGPMGTVRGGGRNADYFQRQAVLEAEAVRARIRLDEALRTYNQLR